MIRALILVSDINNEFLCKAVTYIFTKKNGFAWLVSQACVIRTT